MDFTPATEEELFRKTVATFVEKEVTPFADEFEKKGEFPASLFKRAGELGYFGLRYPPKYGGYIPAAASTTSRFNLSAMCIFIACLAFW